MTDTTKKIGILTSGGDAPGMNAAIRAVVRSALHSNIEVLGILRGYNGLISGDIINMDFKSVSDIMHHGGTVLKTARCDEFMTERGMDKALGIIEKFQIDALVTIGGDGTLRGARELSLRGVKTIGIPGTIDNDIDCSDYTIGFDSALNTAVEAVDRLRDTSISHGRISVVEVMGRAAGHLALSVGIATGAVIALIPERPFDMMRDVVDVLKQAVDAGKEHNIVIVSEGVDGGASRVVEVLKALTGYDLRLTILGHIQRGGTPTAMDRVNATVMGVRAVELLKNADIGRVVAIKDDKLVDLSFEDAFAMRKNISEEFYLTSKAVSK